MWRRDPRCNAWLLVALSAQTRLLVVRATPRLLCGTETMLELDMPSYETSFFIKVLIHTGKPVYGRYASRVRDDASKPLR